MEEVEGIDGSFIIRINKEILSDLSVHSNHLSKHFSIFHPGFLRGSRNDDETFFVQKSCSLPIVVMMTISHR